MQIIIPNYIFIAHVDLESVLSAENVVETIGNELNAAQLIAHLPEQQQQQQQQQLQQTIHSPQYTQVISIIHVQKPQSSKSRRSK